ncbi:helix-turn-helix domain-containing protein [Oceanobacillus sp. FSL H7-0719]|uniref:helix-turn-helix domain-containing protein n=1 Tax=Oceanobacillus sp. FSL H7-0719 TaxID=2954507 RepID=UPI00324B0BAA
MINLSSFEGSPKSLINFSGLGDPNNQIKYHNKFKEIAALKNVSQRDVSRITGINPSNLNQIFNNTNKSNPRLDTFLKIWIVLGCPPLNKCLYRVED